jgi:hypothetical protein
VLCALFLIQVHSYISQIDKQGKFREDSFQKAIAAAGEGIALQAKRQKKDTDQGETSDIFRLVKLLVEKRLDPVCTDNLYESALL